MAIAPQRLGIGIRRHFTTPGVDPYDEVVWERRDARITNYRDGSVAFEQLGVEVPASWSVNATNILAQKYFRGTLGTPEREYSLRQVADRVVDTITAWGTKDGYFLDKEEAEAFSAELKHLIIHQKAAFNSPVWFNIGVKGVPQQASACQPYHALVSTPDGLVPIGRLVETSAVGAKVYDANGVTRVVAVKHNGRRDVLKVTTKAGHVLEVTGDHLVWRVSGVGTGRFVPASELKPGDQLEWHDREDLVDAAPTVRAVEIGSITEAGAMDVYDIQTESGEYLSGNLRVHNCFILAVEDTMDSILNWYVEEGTIFKGGSGAGINLSRIRSSQELLQGGGTASGPVSFMRGADASAGTIKSGGKTRRAAKMVILNADHPDVEDFIWCKAVEERKARVLRDAGFDMDLDGKDSHSTQYQNANNSVRVTDEFMQAVVDDADWHLRAVSDGSILRTLKARDLFRQISEAAWECADPGMQFDTTINRWHTASNTGPINGSNPCFTGDSLVHTDKGLIAFKELFQRANEGETFGVYTHDATNVEAPAQRIELTTPEALMITGVNDIVRLRFDNGAELRCTPGHKIFTINRGYVEAALLTSEDKVKALDLPTPAAAADYMLPVSAELADYLAKGDHSDQLHLPEAWTSDFAHYLGWLVGDGSTSGSTTATIYGSAEDRTYVLPRHQELVESINGHRPLKLSEQANGTAQLRLSRQPFKRFLEALGLGSVKGAEKHVPWSVQQAPSEIAGAFLQGLFDADGCVRRDDSKGSYVGLGSISKELLQGAQLLLSTLGVSSHIYRSHGSSESGHLPYTATDGTTRTYGRAPSYDLRISSKSIAAFAATVGFSLPRKSEALSALVADCGFYDIDRSIRLIERSDEGRELTYNLSEPRNHSYVVNGVVVRNCSEYMHLDNSACNLASLNLLTFLQDDGSFDVEAFRAAVEVIFTAQEILVGNADYPTESIAATSRRFRQLGIGYANLGALLMAQGLPYDSDEGRAWAAAITALMTGHSYATSARTAARMGPFAGYTDNAEPMLKVLRMHREAVADIDEEVVPTSLLTAAQEAWELAVETAEQYGVRNSQASVLAPTGCLVGGTLVPTGRGLVRLGSLGDVDGDKWQDLVTTVQTDEGPQEATKFFVNGVANVVTVDTGRGYRIQGTPEHRVKVVVEETGQWEWRRFGEIRPGDLVPLALDQLVGEPQVTPLPPMPDAYWTSDYSARVPRQMTAELAELIGYFMGDGSLHSRGLRFCVSAGDFDVVERLERLGKELFGLQAAVAAKTGYTEVRFDSVRLVLWWEACGFAKSLPFEGHSGKGYAPRIPDAVLHSNDRAVYSAFLRGLFEADGTVTNGYPVWSTTGLEFSRDVQSLLLALGFVTTRKLETVRTGWGKAPLAVLRLLNLAANGRWLEQVGFLGDRKNYAVKAVSTRQSGRHDHIPLTRELVDRLAPVNDRLRKVLLLELSRGTVTRQIASELYEQTQDPELGHLLSFFYDRVASADLGEDELTYDISVPANVTYVANGFVSHNTIGLLMDCDTTGVEPDLGLVKLKKLVGGGTMSIVNQTVPRALERLGYSPEQIDSIIAYIDENKTILGAPQLALEHLPVFACSMGDNVIHYRGHVRMMGAVQPFISGAISKTVNMPEEATVEEIEQLHIEAWQLGIKAVAIYRDNCKVAQPLSTAKKDGAEAPMGAAEVTAAANPVLAAKIAELEKALAVQTVIVKQPIRERLPKRRRSNTFKFRVADCEGYVHVGEYEDGRPGELFLKISKQGSTLAGIMDAFGIAISMGLQNGVPLSTYVKQYTNMRFEPAGMTDDPDLRLATSLVDYIFRRLAVDYMPYSERVELGILTSDERTQPTLPGVDEIATPTVGIIEETTRVEPEPQASLAVTTSPVEEGPIVLGRTEVKDAPYCYQCGNAMQRAGSCYVCASCGTTSGCS